MIFPKDPSNGESYPGNPGAMNGTNLMASVSNCCPIGSILFCEFDNTAGPKITYEVPEGRFSASGLFDQINSYIIPKMELTSRQLTVTTGPYKVVGYPVQIEHTKYQRNALMFNMCFVFQSNSNVSPYEPIVKKLGEYLRTVEVETGYMSSAESKATLPQHMQRLLTDLNNLGRCSVELNKSNTLFLKVVPPERNRNFPSVHEYEVPVLISDSSSLGALEGDLTTRQIVPLIDGVRNIHQISEEVDADGDLVRACVQNMMFYNIAKVVPPFSLSNVHRVMPGLQKFVADPALQKECMKYIARDSGDTPTLREIMIVFGDMQHGVTVKNLLTRHSSIASKIDEKKLCDFGIMHGFIRRVYKYPIYLRYCHATSRSQTVMRWCNGSYHTDDIKVKHELPANSTDLDDRIESDQFVCVCWK